MMHYLGNFFAHNGQVTAILAISVVWLGFTCIGAMSAGSRRLAEADIFCGWAVVSVVFVALGVFSDFSFTLIAGLVALIAAASEVLMVRRGLDGSLLTMAKLVAVGAPLLVLASAVSISQWDEFTDWAIIPRYMLTTDHFPGKGNPFTNASYAAYPYSWHFVGYLAGRVGGGLIESAGALMNLALLLSFAMVSVRLVGWGAARPDWAQRPAWWLIGLAALSTTLLCPTFAQKVVITYYADTSSAVAAGIAAVLAWRILVELAAGEPSSARTLAWQLGLVLLLLVNLKQATFVLFVLITIALLLMAWRDPAIRLWQAVRLLPMIVIPPIAIYLMWRYHVTSELVSGEFALRPFAEWHIDILPNIISTMLLVLAKKGYYLALVIILIGFGLRALWRPKNDFDRLAGTAALIILGYEAFLLLAYTASFGRPDALRAASYWRYNMHLGLIVVAFTVFGLAKLWRLRAQNWAHWKRFAWVPVILVMAAPLAFANKLRFDREPWITHYRMVTAEAAPKMQAGERLAILDPLGSGESSAIARFETDGQATFVGFLGAFHNTSTQGIQSFMQSIHAKWLIVFSLNPAAQAEINLPLEIGTTYLLEKDGNGWRIDATWRQAVTR